MRGRLDRRYLLTKHIRLLHSSSPGDCKGDLRCLQRVDDEPVPGCTDLIDIYKGIDFCYDVNDIQRPTGNNLERVGNNGNPLIFPLPKCKGDCDNSDQDCEGSLLCFQRSAGDPGPPGCMGTPVGDTDYCYDPQDFPSTGTLDLVGNDGSPSSVYPLKACQGDCDSSDGTLQRYAEQRNDP